VPWLIDGYNLLHVTGLFGRGADNSLAGSRSALMGFLAAALTAAERKQTTVVFDAAEAPPGLPSEYVVHGTHMRFAKGYASADELLEEMIAASHTPKRLVVVSSDRRVQRAALKRRAKPVDSHVWYAELAEKLKTRSKGRKGTQEREDIKPEGPLSPGEVAAWVEMFGAAAAEPVERKPSVKTRATRRSHSAVAGVEKKPRHSRTVRKAAARSTSGKRKRNKPKDLGMGSVENPFPPGYGEDLLES
jgi:predicted RNA-binding protein with PIN domain